MNIFKSIFLLIAILVLCSTTTLAQTITVKGKITDNKTKEPLIGVNVTTKDNKASITNLNGDYEIQLSEGKQTLTISYVGYTEIQKDIDVKADAENILDITLEEEAKNVLGDELVVTGSMFQKKASEEVISIEVVKPKLIQNTNVTRIDEALRRVSGINVADGQANIRGGSGWAYGVGSRVGFVLDGQTILSPDRGDIKWSLLPIETVGQIEVLKGASSVLYGSSAMNGTIHLQTVVPTKKPQTRFTSFVSFYGPPKRKETKWWEIPQPSTGVSFMRAHKVSNHFEYTVGGTAFIQNQQYQDGLEYLARLNYRTKWISKKNEKLSWGLAGSFSYNRETEFFYWQNSRDGAYKPAANNIFTNIRITIDPYVTIFDKKNNKHEILTRTYFNRPSFDTKTLLNNIDYRFTKQYVEKDLTIIAGANNQLLWINVPSFGGSPNKVANLFASYLQLDKKYKRLTLSGGVRLETFTYQKKSGVTGSEFRKNGKLKFYLPGQWRAGLNYQATKKASIRFNIGQAYRFPSFAERYVDETLGNADISRIDTTYQTVGDTVYVYTNTHTISRYTLAVLPNVNLVPEYGWTTEFGYQQKLASKGKKYSGLIDIAFFWQQYKNLVDFNVNLSDTTVVAIVKLKAENITDARIAGLDISLKHAITQKKHNLNIMTGYTYTLPIAIDKYLGYNLHKIGPYFKAFFTHMFTPITGDTASYVLKYRNRHLITLDFEYVYDNKLTLGIDARYYSNQENFDKLFLGIPGAGIDEYYRNMPKKGNFIVNARAFYTIKDKHTFGFIVKNLSNREYWLRVGKLEPPINFTMQYRYEF
ncbi:MAG TPA: TonB-dependent receptor [Chitinophagales bacterium]|nr:TonB-dependent receptor [Chitinophagales bacterium]HMX61061.1 TonB-dependent receptor [Chitinophagales bacterium]HMY24090.1 TonB-dependent receptor [Chitinophagales bacterium]HMZ34653.1 TonB-dependent receptor [Chitinophagales bacterium]HNA39378.1 TonB-dependent receptor [Chitinophagales bacterium]